MIVARVRGRACLLLSRTQAELREDPPRLVGEAREGAVELAAAREVEQGGGAERLRVDLAGLGVGVGAGLRVGVRV